MRKWFLPLAVIAVAATSLAQAPNASAEQQLRQRVLEARVELAEAAFGLDLFREAGAGAGAVSSAEPTHAIDALRQRIKQLATDEFVRRYKDASKKHGKAFAKRVKQRLGPLANEAFGLAEAAPAGEQAARERLLVLALELDPDHDKVLQALRKSDYEVIFNYGVVPGAEKEDARKLLKSLGGGFLGRSELAGELEFWSDAWGLRTRHYRFVTDAPHGIVFAFARACEDLYVGLEGFMAANKQSLRELTKPCTVYLLRSRVDYEAILRLSGIEPADSDGALGFYMPSTKIGYFFHDAGFYGDDTTLLFETFFHEGAHQMFDLRAKTAWRGLGDGAPLHWVEEGFAVYLESLVVDPLMPGRPATFGRLIDDDLADAIEAIGKGELKPMDEFAHLSEADWDAYDQGYPHAALVVHWLLTADGGKRAGKAFELLTAERQNGGLRKGTVFDLIGVSAEDADRLLREHATRIGGTLTKRKYRDR